MKALRLAAPTAIAALAVLSPGGAWAGSNKPITLAVTQTAPGPAPGGPAIALVPGGGAVHVEADDQDGNRLMPGLFTWAVPAGAMIGVQEDQTGWLVTTPQGAAPGNYAIPVQYNPQPALSPTAAIAVAKAITAIRIVVSPP